MAGTLSVDVGELHGAEAAIAGLSGDVGDLLCRLNEGLAVEGSCWGTDAMGATFADAYLPAVQVVQDALPDLCDRIRDIGAAVALVAQRVDATDDRAQFRLR